MMCVWMDAFEWLFSEPILENGWLAGIVFSMRKLENGWLALGKRFPKHDVSLHCVP